jgi:hypothetical protein
MICPFCGQKILSFAYLYKYREREGMFCDSLCAYAWERQLKREEKPDASSTITTD